MPKFEVTQFGDNQELIFKPTDGDLRYLNFGPLERFNAGAWMYIGNLDTLFGDFEVERMKTDKLDNWMIEQQAKDRAQIIADELEDQFADLAEAGQHLRQLEKMLRVARKTYDSMTEDVKERLKTFERLDTPYPDGEGPGYSI